MFPTVRFLALGSFQVPALRADVCTSFEAIACYVAEEAANSPSFVPVQLSEFEHFVRPIANRRPMLSCVRSVNFRASLEPALFCCSYADGVLAGPPSGLSSPEMVVGAFSQRHKTPW